MFVGVRVEDPTWRFGCVVIISGVINRVTVLETHTRGLIALLITTHEPPSRVSGLALVCVFARGKARMDRATVACDTCSKQFDAEIDKITRTGGYMNMGWIDE